MAWWLTGLMASTGLCTAILAPMFHLPVRFSCPCLGAQENIYTTNLYIALCAHTITPRNGVSPVAHEIPVYS